MYNLHGYRHFSYFVCFQLFAKRFSLPIFFYQSRTLVAKIADKYFCKTFATNKDAKQSVRVYNNSSPRGWFNGVSCSRGNA